MHKGRSFILFAILAGCVPASVIAADSQDSPSGLQTPQMDPSLKVTPEIKYQKQQVDPKLKPGSTNKATDSIKVDPDKLLLPAIQKNQPGMQSPAKPKAAPKGIQPRAISGDLHIDSISPATGDAGTEVTLTGRNFGPAAEGRRIMIRNSRTAVMRRTEISSWSNNNIRVRLPADLEPGPSTIHIHIAVGGTGPTNLSNSVAFNVTGMPRLPDDIATPRQDMPGGFAGPAPQLSEEVTGCPDPAIELRIGWPQRNADGTYMFRLLALVTNQGNATFSSARNQTGVTINEGGRALHTSTWSSRWANKVELVPGAGTTAGLAFVESWNPGSEFLADFSAAITYDPDIRADGNRANDDCGSGNNRATLSVAEVRRTLESVR